MPDPAAREPSTSSFTLDAEALTHLNDLSQFYSGLGRSLSRSAIVRRAIAMLANAARQWEQGGHPDELLVEMLVSSGHSKLRPAAPAPAPAPVAATGAHE